MAIKGKNGHLVVQWVERPLLVSARVMGSSLEILSPSALPAGSLSLSPK